MFSATAPLVGGQPDLVEIKPFYRPGDDTFRDQHGIVKLMAHMQADIYGLILMVNGIVMGKIRPVQSR